jgi:hypothetical protein
METDRVSETLFSTTEFWTLAKVYKPGYYTCCGGGGGGGGGGSSSIFIHSYVHFV